MKPLCVLAVKCTDLTVWVNYILHSTVPDLFHISLYLAFKVPEILAIFACGLEQQFSIVLGGHQLLFFTHFPSSSWTLELDCTIWSTLQYSSVGSLWERTKGGRHRKNTFGPNINSFVMSLKKSGELLWKNTARNCSEAC